MITYKNIEKIDNSIKSFNDNEKEREERLLNSLKRNNNDFLYDDLNEQFDEDIVTINYYDFYGVKPSDFF